MFEPSLKDLSQRTVCLLAITLNNESRLSGVFLESTTDLIKSVVNLALQIISYRIKIILKSYHIISKLGHRIDSVPIYRFEAPRYKNGKTIIDS